MSKSTNDSKTAGTASPADNPDIPGAPVASAVAALPAIFRECVDPGSVRYGIDRPYARDGHVYATDARMIVRMPAGVLAPGVVAALDPASRSDHPRVPDGAAIFNTFPDSIYAAEPIPLPECGDGMEDCPECGGDGMYRDDRAIVRDAEGNPYECAFCEGEKRLLAHDAGVRVAPDIRLGTHLVHRLNRHGATAYRPAGLPVSVPHADIKRVRSAPLKFTVPVPGEPGVVAEGRLMGMTIGDDGDDDGGDDDDASSDVPGDAA